MQLISAQIHYCHCAPQISACVTGYTTGAPSLVTLATERWFKHLVDMKVKIYHKN